jgi:hypothetical protein
MLIARYIGSTQYKSPDHWTRFLWATTKIVSNIVGV